MWTAGRGLHACLDEHARMAELSARPRPSPWSSLEWESTLDELDQVLVPL